MSSSASSLAEGRHVGDRLKLGRTGTVKHGAILLFAWFITSCIGLGSPALWEPDEPRFAAATRQMVATGDFVTPWFNGRPRFEKPILLYWMQAPFVAVLGPTETAFRLPSALAALASALAIYALCAGLVSPAAGLIAGVCLLTTFRFMLYARQGLTDVPVTAFVTLAVYLFWRALHAPDDRTRRYAWLGWVCVGCAALTKGPVAAVPIIVWAIFLAVRRNRNGLRKWHLLSGVLIALAIALPWHIVMLLRHGETFLRTALGYEVVSRYLSPEFPGPRRGFHYFFVAWLGDGAPWSLFYVAAVTWVFLRWRQLTTDVREGALLSLVWVCVVLLTFSVSQYKLPHYIMPAYPPTALLVGMFVHAVCNENAQRVPRVLWSIPVWLTVVLLTAGAGLLWLLLRRAFELPSTDVAQMLPLALAAGALAARLWERSPSATA
jgi:4-amino-4-deoxy-L-arabinose transferase-like glycosyltransferase